MRLEEQKPAAGALQTTDHNDVILRYSENPCAHCNFVRAQQAIFDEDCNDALSNICKLRFYELRSMLYKSIVLCTI